MAKIIGFFTRNPKWCAFLIGVIFVFCNLVIANNTRNNGRRYIFWSDAMGYYAYLPSTFIYHDLLGCSYDVDKCFKNADPNKRVIFKYTSGVAILQTPFFLTALGVSQFTETNPDGLSETFEFCITMGTIFYCFMALLLMFSVLKRYVKTQSALITVILAYFGTNLFYYTIGESGMSHAYSFFTMSWFIYSVHGFLDKPTWKNSIQMGFAFGLSTIIRPTNFFIILLPFFLKIQNFKDISTRIQFLTRQPLTYLGVLFAFLAILPQLIYWKLQSGKFLFFSYSEETFVYLKNPHIADILWGNVSGLFVYTPLLLLFIPGLYFMWRKKWRFEAAIILTIFATITYFNASWWCYTFDCGFGHRAFIEYYPMLLIPIAFSFEVLFVKWKSVILTLILVLFFFINVRMSYLYKKYPCWKDDWGIKWGWSNVAYVLRVVFYIDPRPTYHFRVVDK
jgi:hypothetical protein